MQAKLKSHNGKDISVLVYDKAARGAIPHSRHVQAFSDLNDRALESAHNIFIVSTALELSMLTDFVKWAQERKRLRGLLIRQDSYPLWITQLLDKADVRSLRHLLVHSNNEVVKRVLTGWLYGAQNQLIADAAVFGEKLFVRDCALHRYELGFNEIRDLAAIPRNQRTNFFIDEEGSHISWPKQDIDIDLDSIKTALNPEAAQKFKQEHDRAVGAAIAEFRKMRKIKQSEISGLDERHLRRIESGEQHPTHKSLQILASAHKMNLNKYLNEISEHVKLAPGYFA